MTFRIPLFLLTVAALAALPVASPAAVPLPGNPTATASDPSAKALTCPRPVRLRNHTGVPLTLSIDGQPPRHLAAGWTARACPVGDELTWRAAAPSGWQLSGRESLKGVHQRERTLKAPGGSIRIVNATDEAQELQVDGVQVGSMAAESERLIAPLPAGLHTIVARGVRGRDLRPVEQTVPPGDQVDVVLRAGATVAVVRNPLAADVTLRIDGTAYGPLAAGAEIRVLGLAPGPHEARLVDARSGESVPVPLIVRRADAAGLAHAAATASPRLSLEVLNNTGEVLEIPAALRELGPPLQPGDMARWTVPRSTFGVALRGVTSGLTYRLDVNATGPKLREWTLVRPLATLRLYNGSGVALDIDVPGQPPVALPPAGEKVIRVAAGRLHLVAVPVETTKGKKVKTLETGLFLQPGADATWRAQALATTLTVLNEAPEPLQLRVDGEDRGRIGAHGDLRVDLRPGRHEVEVRPLLRPGTTSAVVEVADGDRASVAFGPIDGTLHVDASDRDQPLRLLVRGQQVTEVAAGTTQVVPTGPGRLTAEVRDPADVSTVWSGRVTPGQQVFLPQPDRAQTAIELTHKGQGTLRIALDGGDFVQVATGGIWQSPPVAPGAHLLTIERGGQRQVRRIVASARKPLTRVVLRDVATAP